jgi:hypothetical protein
MISRHDGMEWSWKGLGQCHVCLLLAAQWIRLRLFQRGVWIDWFYIYPWRS